MRMSEPASGLFRLNPEFSIFPLALTNSGALSTNCQRNHKCMFARKHDLIVFQIASLPFF